MQLHTVVHHPSTPVQSPSLRSLIDTAVSHYPEATGLELELHAEPGELKQIPEFTQAELTPPCTGSIETDQYKAHWSCWTDNTLYITITPNPDDLNSPAF